MSLSRCFSAAFVLFLAEGCSSQASPDYRGEPLATLRGTVELASSPHPGALEATVLWLGGPNREGPRAVAAPVAVGSSFPTDFTMELLEPPPREVSHDEESGEANAVVGMIVAVREGMAASIEDPEDPNILGFVVRNYILYFPEDLPEDELHRHSALVNTPAEPGFHLVTNVVERDREEAYYQCKSRGVCMHTIHRSQEEDPERLANLQAWADDEFRRCQEYLPDAEVCTRYSSSDGSRTPEESAASNECWQRWEERPEPEVPCEPPWYFVRTEGNMDHPVTLELGTTFYELLEPRYRE